MSYIWPMAPAIATSHWQAMGKVPLGHILWYGISEAVNMAWLKNRSERKGEE